MKLTLKGLVSKLSVRREIRPEQPGEQLGEVEATFECFGVLTAAESAELDKLTKTSIQEAVLDVVVTGPHVLDQKIDGHRVLGWCVFCEGPVVAGGERHRLSGSVHRQAKHLGLRQNTETQAIVSMRGPGEIVMMHDVCGISEGDWKRLRKQV